MRPSKALLILAILCLLSALPLLAGGEPQGYPPFSSRIERVVLISIDSARPEYISPEYMPNLWKLVSRGAVFVNAKTIFTCNTIPAHASMLTGAYPEATGIVGNAYYFEENGTTIIASRRGLRHAETIFEANPDLTTVFISGKWWLAPLLADGADVVISPPRGRTWKGGRFLFKVPPPVTAFSGDADDYWTVSAMIEVARAVDFDFMFVNLAWTDESQHIYGPFSEPVRNHLRTLDRLLAKFFRAMVEAGKFSTTLFVITSDHGQVLIREAVDLYSPLKRAGIDAFVQNEGTAAIIFLRNKSRLMEAASILRGVEGVESIFIRGLNYSLIRWPEYGDIAVSLEEGYVVAVAPWSRVGIAGSHGGLPTQRVPLVFFGPGISRRTVEEEASIVDIVPTIASIMGWNIPKTCEGRDLHEVVLQGP